MAEHGGTVPDDPATLESFPGIGKYTAGAVASFAFERRAPAIDTNALRVLERVFRPRAENGAGRPRVVHELAQRILPGRRRAVWEFNQALMDLGSSYCTARRPKCPECPVRPACRTGRPR